MPRFQTTSVNRKWTETRSAFRLTKLWSESTCNVNANRTEFFFTSLFDSSVKTNIFRAVFILLVISGVISVEKLVNKSILNVPWASWKSVYLWSDVRAVKSPAPPSIINKICILFIHEFNLAVFCSYCICIPSFNQNHVAPFFSIYLIF